jgi:hypothetical protein
MNNISVDIIDDLRLELRLLWFKNSFWSSSIRSLQNRLLRLFFSTKPFLRCDLLSEKLFFILTIVPRVTILPSYFFLCSNCLWRWVYILNCLWIDECIAEDHVLFVTNVPPIAGIAVTLIESALELFELVVEVLSNVHLWLFQRNVLYCFLERPAVLLHHVSGHNNECAAFGVDGVH